MSNERNTIKYSIHVQVNGIWRHDGWIEPAHPVEADRLIAEAREQCIRDNGKDTFRSFAFLDQPLPEPTENEKAVLNLVSVNEDSIPVAGD